MSIGGIIGIRILYFISPITEIDEEMLINNKNININININQMIVIKESYYYKDKTNYYLCISSKICEETTEDIYDKSKKIIIQKNMEQLNKALNSDKYTEKFKEMYEENNKRIIQEKISQLNK